MVGEQNLIERAWEVFERHHRERGVSTDEVSFVGGFLSCFGVLTGRVDIGLAPDTPVLKLFERVQKELDQMRAKVIEAQRPECEYCKRHHDPRVGCLEYAKERHNG